MKTTIFIILFSLMSTGFCFSQPTINCVSNQIRNTSPGSCTYTAMGVEFDPVNYTGTGATIAYSLSGATGGGAGSSTLAGIVFNAGITTVTWTVTDNVMNTATCSFTVTVNDNENPMITCPSNITVSNDAGLCTAVVTYNAPAGIDNCPGASTVQTAGLPSGATFPVGTTTNKFKATDASGNTNSCSFTVTVIDNENPTLTVPGNQVVIANNGSTYIVTGTQFNPISINDNCLPAPTLTYILSGATAGNGLNTLAGVQFDIGVTTVCWTATDASANTITACFTVTVNPASGISEKSYNSQINIYFNSANRTITINCCERQNIILSIYNLIGALVLQKELENSKSEIDIGSLKAGMYIIRVSFTDRTMQKKIIIN